MKLKKIYLIVSFVLFFVLFVNLTEAKAMNTGFSTKEISEKRRSTFLSNFKVSLLKTVPERRGIRCFDVNEEGLIAIGQEGPQSKEVCVYTPQGEFLYGYVFESAQSFGVEWDKQNINLYLVRSDVIVSLDSDANILDIKAVLDTTDNNKYSDSLLYSTERVVGDTTYILRNDLGILNWIALSYSQIITIDGTGTERIIYDVNSTQLIKMIVVISSVCILFLVIAVIASQSIKSRHEN